MSNPQLKENVFRSTEWSNTDEELMVIEFSVPPSLRGTVPLASAPL